MMATDHDTTVTLEPRPATDAGPRSRRTTGPELEARFDDWRCARRGKREHRAAALTPQVRSTRRRNRLAALLGAALCGVVVLSSVQGRSFEQQHADNAAAISRLQAELEQVAVADEPSETTVPDGDELVALGERALTAATEVATKQQRFAELHHAAVDTPSQDNGAPSDVDLQLVEHRRSLAEHWAESSLVVAEEQAYEFTTVRLFAEDVIDPRFPWYVRHVDQRPADPAGYGWRVGSVMPVVETPGTVRAVWTNIEHETGLVLAWASATYDDQTGRFLDLEVVVTTAGVARDSQTAGTEVPELPQEES